MNNALTILPQSEENSFSDKYKIWDIDHKKMLLAYTRPAKAGVRSRCAGTDIPLIVLYGLPFP